jgi:hypothetical protein
VTFGAGVELTDMVEFNLSLEMLPSFEDPRRVLESELFVKVDCVLNVFLDEPLVAFYRIS